MAVSGSSQPGGLRLGLGPLLTVALGAAPSPRALCRQRGVRASPTAPEPLVFLPSSSPDLPLATFVSNDSVPQRASRLPQGSWELSIPIKQEKDQDGSSVRLHLPKFALIP